MSNRTAFLDMLAHSEGTSTCPKTQNSGYDVIVGGTVFSDYSDHPRILVDLGNGLKSTAAGRYQLLERFFDVYKAQLGLPDFSPSSQDAIALQQIKECHALDDIDSGNFDSAVNRVAHIWASLPGAGYNQHENRIDSLRTAYQQSGGSIN